MKRQQPNVSLSECPDCHEPIITYNGQVYGPCVDGRCQEASSTDDFPPADISGYTDRYPSHWND